MVIYKVGTEPVITDFKNNAIIPRVGECIISDGLKYTVLMVTYDLDANFINVSLQKQYKLNETCHAVRKERSSKG